MADAELLPRCPEQVEQRSLVFRRGPDLVAEVACERDAAEDHRDRPEVQLPDGQERHVRCREIRVGQLLQQIA